MHAKTSSNKNQSSSSCTRASEGSPNKAVEEKPSLKTLYEQYAHDGVYLILMESMDLLAVYNIIRCRCNPSGSDSASSKKLQFSWSPRCFRTHVSNLSMFLTSWQQFIRQSRMQEDKSLWASSIHFSICPSPAQNIPTYHPATLFPTLLIAQFSSLPILCQGTKITSFGTPTARMNLHPTEKPFSRKFSDCDSKMRR